MNMIRLSKSSIGKNEKQAVLRVLNGEYLGMGTEVKNFEDMLSDFFGRPTVCVNSGTAAIQLALQALGVGVGDEVLVQSLTFVATYQAVSATGALPVSCEINPWDISIDIEDAKRRLTSKTKAIIPVHYASGVGKLDEVYSFAKKYDLRVIEDAAHAFGTVYSGHRVGGIGDIACFSFDGIKNITSGEGGAIVSEDESVIEKIKDARLLGVKKDTENRFKGRRSWEFDVVSQGWRYHMSNIMAAIGSEQLKRFPEMANKRKALAGIYCDLLRVVDNIEPLALDYENIVPHIFVVKVGQKKNELRNFLIKNGIECGIHYYPNHRLSKYMTSYDLPKTDKVYSQLLTLPCHVDLPEKDLLYVVSKIKEFFDV